MDQDLEKILSYLNEKRGVDFFGYRPSMIGRRAKNRLAAVRMDNFPEYLGHIKKNEEELNNLINVLTINVSRFFRNPLTFEYIADRVLPALATQIKEVPGRSLRVWSAGCSTGEEPYSMAILIDEFMKNEALKFGSHVFATDIDEEALKNAREGVYRFESIKDLKYRFLKQYFTIHNETYTLNPEIKELVNFSIYDMLDPRTSSPPESIFGGFDMVLCRNVLIYFSKQYQEKIFEKLCHSLVRGGYLVLGRAEIPMRDHRIRFERAGDCPIYRKL